MPPGTASAPRKRQRRKQLIDKNIKRTEYRTNETTDSLRAKKFSGRVNTPYLCLQRCEALMLRKSRSRSQGTRNEPVLATSHPPRPLSQKQLPPACPKPRTVARFMLSSAGHRRPERPGHKKAGTFSGPGPIVARSRTQRYSADGWACMTISSSPSRISISRSPSIRYESIRSSSLINRSSCA